MLYTNEADKLILRHYHDKSLIDEWASWWQKRSVLHKAIIASSIICIAGFIGAIIELSILFILFTSGLLYFLHSTLLQHDEHRRLYNEQCVTEIRNRTQKLNELSSQLNAISYDMTKPQEEIKTHAEAITKNNNRMDIQTKQLIQKQESLHKLVDSTCKQTEKMEKTYDNLIKAAEKLATTIQLANSSLNCAAQSNNQIQSSLNLDKTLALQHQIELGIKKLSSDINTFIQQVSVLDCESQAEVENSIEKTRRALTAVEGLQTQHVATTAQVENETSMAATMMIANDLLECMSSDRDYQLSRLKTRNTLELVRKLRVSLLTAPLHNRHGSDLVPHPNQTMKSEPRPSESEKSDSDSDIAYKMSRKKTRNTLAIVRARRAQLELEAFCFPQP